MASDWPLIGLAMAMTLLFSIGVAVWTRTVARSRIQGQTFWHVVVGVAGVVVISGIKIGIDTVAFLLICFSLAALPMAYEYFDRVQREEREAQKIRETLTDVDETADR